MRNVKQFARTYATLFIFTCELFEMPLALLGFLTSYAFWELFKLCVGRWESNRHPLIRNILIRVALCETVSFLAFLNAAVFYALAITYAVVIILHGVFKIASPFPRSNLERYRTKHSKKTNNNTLRWLEKIYYYF